MINFPAHPDRVKHRKIWWLSAPLPFPPTPPFFSLFLTHLSSGHRCVHVKFIHHLSPPRPHPHPLPSFIGIEMLLRCWWRHFCCCQFHLEKVWEPQKLQQQNPKNCHKMSINIKEKLCKLRKEKCEKRTPPQNIMLLETLICLLFATHNLADLWMKKLKKSKKNCYFCSFHEL